jgi:hypothetical protein
VLKLLRCHRIKQAISVVLLVALTSLFLVAAPQVVTRTWKSSDGAYSIDAEYVGSKEGKVSLRKPNGAVVEVSLARLSAEDQAYVEKQAAATDGADINRRRDDVLELIKKVESEMSAGAFAPMEDKSLVHDQQQSGAIFDPESLTPADKDVIGLFRKVKQGSVGATPAVEIPKTPAETEAAAQQNLATRNEFVRGLLRGIDTTQAAFYRGLEMLSSAMGDDTTSDLRFEQYREQMRQASENPRLAPTFLSMMDDPLSWLSATTGEYALLTLFCISIFAGVFLWISKLRSRNDTEGNSKKGITVLDRNETFFWTRVVQDDKVVYTYRNYKIFYFCILPLLVSFTAIPVIGLIPLLSWIFYWGIYPRPNKEIAQLLKEVRGNAMGSKFSSENPMRLTFSRTDFDRIVLRRGSTTTETSQSTSATTLLNPHLDSSSSDTELESLKKKNEALKRKVEAKKLAEKRAKEIAALEAENARMMAELGEDMEVKSEETDLGKKRP